MFTLYFILCTICKCFLILGVRHYVKIIEPLNREEIRKISQKLEKCRNQDNNPESEA